MPTFDWDIAPTIFKYPEWLSFLPGDGLRYYSLLYVMVFLGGFHLFSWQLRRAGGTEEEASDFVLYGVIATLAGSRMGHVFFYDFDKFKEDPMWLFRIWEGGLASHGGMIGVTLAMVLFAKVKRQSFFEASDRFAFSCALATMLIRLGNFFNSEIVGRKTDQSWGVRFIRVDGPAGDLRHPSQLYEFALGCFVMLSLYLADKAWGKEKRPRGAMISLFFAVYFTGRFLVEYVKDFQTLQSDSALTMGQWLSIIPAAVGYIGLAIAFKKRIPARWNVYAAPTDDDLDKELAEDDGDDDVDSVLAEKPSKA